MPLKAAYDSSVIPSQTYATEEPCPNFGLWWGHRNWWPSLESAKTKQHFRCLFCVFMVYILMYGGSL